MLLSGAEAVKVGHRHHHHHAKKHHNQRLAQQKKFDEDNVMSFDQFLSPLKNQLSMAVSQ